MQFEVNYLLLLLIVTSVFVVVILWLFYGRNKRKYFISLVRKENGVFNFLYSKAVNGLNKTVRYKKHTFVFEPSFPTYIKGLKVFYFLDVTKNYPIHINDGEEIKSNKSKELVDKDDKKELQVEVLKFGHIKGLINAEDLDLITHRSVLSDLSSGIKDSVFSMGLLNIVLYILVGVFIGYMIGSNI